LINGLGRSALPFEAAYGLSITVKRVAVKKQNEANRQSNFGDHVMQARILCGAYGCSSQLYAADCIETAFRLIRPGPRYQHAAKPRGKIAVLKRSEICEDRVRSSHILDGFMMSWRMAAKALAYAIAPNATLRALSIRSRRKIERQIHDVGLDRVARIVSLHTNAQVASGPFKGLTMDYDALPVHGAPKLLGTYEKEIGGFVEDAIAKSPSRVVNVGASDGYYAVGLARRLPEAKIFVADADPKSVRATTHNAKLNGVSDRIVAIGIIQRGSFAKYLTSPGELVVMDCEGAEFGLLDPKCDPVLNSTNIIVEVHSHAGSFQALADRFAVTHNVKVARSTDRTPSDLSITIPEVDLVDAMHEGRSSEVWLYMTTKSLGGVGMLDRGGV
jgi:hypothetical protein